jgi:hypothetical protein
VKKFLQDPHIPYRVRAYMYRVLLAVVPLLISFSLITEFQAGYIVGLLGAVLGLGTATVYTETKKWD